MERLPPPYLLLIMISLAFSPLAVAIHRPCDGLLTASIEISSPPNGMIFASQADITPHLVHSPSSKALLPASTWGVTAKEYGFGGQTQGLTLTNIGVLRDGVLIGHLGFTENRRAVLISEMQSSQDAVTGKLSESMLRLQKRLIEAKVMKPAFGWFMVSNKIHLVREIQPGSSIHRFNRFSAEIGVPEIAVNTSFDQSLTTEPKTGIIPELSLQHLQNVERILDLDLGDYEGHQLIFYPEQLWLIQSGAPMTPESKRFSPQTVSRYLGMIRWVFAPNGAVSIDGIGYFLKNYDLKDSAGYEAWFEARGARVLGVRHGQYGHAVPEYSTWARYFFALHASNSTAKSYLFSLIEKKPESMAKLNFLIAIIGYLDLPRFNRQRGNFLLGSLFGNTDNFINRLTGRFGVDDQSPYPRPQNLKFATQAKLKNHVRHASEFGLSNAADYLAYANQRILSAPTNNRIYIVRTSGDILAYDEVEEWVAVFHPNGTLKTFFKPDPSTKNFSLIEGFHGSAYFWFLQILSEFTDDF